MIICIGREFGSGGHEIGKLLAEAMGIPFYDRQLVDVAIKSNEAIAEAIERVDERKTNTFLYSVWYETVDKELGGMPSNDILFKLQSEAIVELSQSGEGAFVGRCADFILDKAEIEHISLFIAAPFSDRVKRKMDLLQKEEKVVTALVRKTDKQRKAYYNYYTNGSWGKPDQYDLCINSSVMRIEGSVQMLRTIMGQRNEI